VARSRSSASGPPVASTRRGASGAAKSPAKSVPAAKLRTSRVLAVNAAAKAAIPAASKRNPTAAASAKAKPPPLSYIAVWRATPLERIDMIRRGVPASEAKRIFAELAIGQGVGFKALNLSTATVNKKAKQGDTLSPEESERIVGFAKLVGQLEAMIQDSGEPSNFDARAWMARWLTEPLPAFGGARPADLVDTMEGQGLVSAALAKMQSGAYA
jgi:putative toxin-antitoxin system antitoxin component (TIGR02293 family)